MNKEELEQMPKEELIGVIKALREEIERQSNAQVILDNEITNTNSIINDFEEWLKDKYNYYEDNKEDGKEMAIIYNAKWLCLKEILDKIQELRNKYEK